MILVAESSLVKVCDVETRKLLDCVKVNGHCLLGSSHAEALSALRSIETHVVLVICDGYNHIAKDLTLSTSSLSDISTCSLSEKVIRLMVKYS
jgi:acetylornithine/succinyldiaminopimelate/putrescine aminotransferase